MCCRRYGEATRMISSPMKIRLIPCMCSSEADCEPSLPVSIEYSNIVVTMLPANTMFWRHHVILKYQGRLSLLQWSLPLQPVYFSDLVLCSCCWWTVLDVSTKTDKKYKHEIGQFTKCKGWLYKSDCVHMKFAPQIVCILQSLWKKVLIILKNTMQSFMKVLDVQKCYFVACFL